MNDISVSNQLQSLIKTEIASIKNDIESIDDRSLNELLDILEHDIDFQEDTKYERYIYSLSSIESINARLDFLSLSQKTSPKSLNAINNIITKIKNISTYIWQLICRHGTLKTWSISGDLAVKPFGLGGSVRLELSFGKNKQQP